MALKGEETTKNNLIAEGCWIKETRLLPSKELEGLRTYAKCPINKCEKCEHFFNYRNRVNELVAKLANERYRIVKILKESVFRRGQT